MNKQANLEQILGLVMKAGLVNLRTMELLDSANPSTHGDPVPTNVPLGAKRGKAILVYGHDLKDLELILKQSESKVISIYIHGEMLPAHDYPSARY